MKNVHEIIRNLRLQQLTSRYTFVDENKMLGSGSFGKVFKAVDNDTSTLVAVKFFEKLEGLDIKFLFREICILHLLKGENFTVRLLDIAFSKEGSLFKGMALVFEHYQANLEILINSSTAITDQNIQHIMHQLFNAVAYLHSAHIIHRDIKPSNILINNDCKIALCDFGLSRSVQSIFMETEREFPALSRRLTKYVVTRWYRAPEIILEADDYGTMTDIWGLGCILAELLIRTPLFMTNKRHIYHLLYKIIDTIGTPTPEEITWVHPRFVGLIYNGSQPKQSIIDEIFKDKNPIIVDLIKKILQFQPSRRLSAHDASNHAFFTDSPVLRRDCNFNLARLSEHEINALKDYYLTENMISSSINTIKKNMALATYIDNHIARTYVSARAPSLISGTLFHRSETSAAAESSKEQELSENTSLLVTAINSSDINQTIETQRQLTK